MESTHGKRRHMFGQTTKRMEKQNLWEKEKNAYDTVMSDLMENSRCDIERNVIEAGSRKITGKHREVIFLPQISVC